MSVCVCLVFVSSKPSKGICKAVRVQDSICLWLFSRFQSSCHSYFDSSFFQQLAFIGASQAVILVFLDTASPAHSCFISWCRMSGDQSHMYTWHKQGWGQASTGADTPLERACAVHLAAGTHAPRESTAQHALRRGCGQSGGSLEQRGWLGKQHTGTWPEWPCLLVAAVLPRMDLVDPSSDRGGSWPPIIFSRRFTQKCNHVVIELRVHCPRSPPQLSCIFRNKRGKGTMCGLVCCLFLQRQRWLAYQTHE